MKHWPPITGTAIFYFFKHIFNQKLAAICRNYFCAIPILIGQKKEEKEEKEENPKKKEEEETKNNNY